MGAKTWMLVYADGSVEETLKRAPSLDRDAAFALTRKLFPSEKLEPLEDKVLSFTCPPDNEIVTGCFSGLSIVAAREFGLDKPSRIAPNFLAGGPGQTIYLHAMHGAVDWFAYAVWKDGRLIRSLSLSADSGVMEDLGDRLPFEVPYWSGVHPVYAPDDDEQTSYPFVFHPLELGEAALRNLFGYHLEGPIDPDSIDPETIPLARYRRVKPWWKIW